MPGVPVARGRGEATARRVYGVTDRAMASPTGEGQGEMQQPLTGERAHGGCPQRTPSVGDRPDGDELRDGTGEDESLRNCAFSDRVVAERREDTAGQREQAGPDAGLHAASFVGITVVASCHVMAWHCRSSSSTGRC